MSTYKRYYILIIGDYGSESVWQQNLYTGRLRGPGECPGYPPAGWKLICPALRMTSTASCGVRRTVVRRFRYRPVAPTATEMAAAVTLSGHSASTTKSSSPNV